MATIVTDSQYVGTAEGLRFTRDRMNKGVTIEVPEGHQITPQKLMGAARQIMGEPVKLDSKRVAAGLYGDNIVHHRYTKKS